MDDSWSYTCFTEDFDASVLANDCGSSWEPDLYWEGEFQGATDDARLTTEAQQDLAPYHLNWDWSYWYWYYDFPRWCATDSSSCGFCDGTIADGKCWDWTEDQDEPGVDAVEASMTMKLSAPESSGEPLEEVFGVAAGFGACLQFDDSTGCRAARGGILEATLSVAADGDDVFSVAAAVDAPEDVTGVGRTCFYTAFDANMRGFGSEDMYGDMSMGLAFDDFTWFGAPLAESEASMAMTGAGSEGFTVSTWDGDAAQGTLVRADCDAVVDLDLSLFMVSPEKRKFKADDVIAGAATFSGITAADADTAAARAVFRDAIARVAGVDKDQVRILSVSAAAAARRRLTESVTVEFEVHPRKREAASVSANLLATEADPALMDAALQAAAADSDDETMVALFADVKTESFTTDVERSAPKKKKKRGEALALYAILLIAAACLCFCACGLAALAVLYLRRGGAAAPPTVCASCGAPLAAGENFCAACGAAAKGPLELKPAKAEATV